MDNIPRGILNAADPQRGCRDSEPLTGGGGDRVKREPVTRPGDGANCKHDVALPIVMISRLHVFAPPPAVVDAGEAVLKRLSLIHI